MYYSYLTNTYLVVFVNDAPRGFRISYIYIRLFDIYLFMLFIYLFNTIVSLCHLLMILQQGFAKGLLDVADNLARAIESVPKDKLDKKVTSSSSSSSSYGSGSINVIITCLFLEFEVQNSLCHVEACCWQ